MRKIPRIAVLLLLTAALLLSMTGCGASDGKTHLTFQIWDVYQRPGMQAMCDAYTAKHPDVEIEVQVTSWSEYWTKLEASGESNTMPDIFWMHTNQLLYYADFGILADVTNLYDDVEANYYQNHFTEISLDNTRGSNGLMYGVPKDKDNVVLVYNKEMFDAAGVSYPDEDWTWDDMVDASEKIYAATGKYGYMAYNDDQIGYWNFVYQAGGYILSEDKTQAGFDQEGTIKAMNFYVNLQKNDWCPDQNYFTETAPGTAFFSEMGAMYFEGNWNLPAQMENFPNMRGKWDIAPLPKCPDPVSGDGRATISNGLCYSTSANGKNRDIALDVIKFFGTEEAQAIQGTNGAAVPAYIGTEETWRHAFDAYSEKLDVDVVFDQFEYGIQSVNNSARPKWKDPVLVQLTAAYTGSQSLDTALQNIQDIVNTETAKKLAGD
ncbi:MAG: sugar ABC transporter substrate-binding protein [Butyricicoccus sp.]|nr:sugar ABC transporter substrate-binding protein [Butyricicoccus sp.]